MTPETKPGGVTHKRVLGIALPILFAYVTIPLLGLVDTGVVGQLGQAAPIGAVGVGAATISLVYWVFGFLRMGTTGLAAQAQGAGDLAERDAIFTRAVIIGLVGGAAIVLLQVPLFAWVVRGDGSEVDALALQYLHIRVWSAPAAIAGYGLTGWLIAVERSRAVLAIQLFTNLTNIALDILFVLGLGLGVAGVATATVIAEWSGLALGVWLCRDVLAAGRWRDWGQVKNITAVKHMLVVNTNIMIRSVLLQLMFFSFIQWSRRFGEVTLAANQVLLQFLTLIAYGLDGFAFAAETLVGQAIGRKSRKMLREGIAKTALWGGGVCLLGALCFALFGGNIIDILAKAPDVQAEARVYLPYMIIAPIVGYLAWMLDGVFIGATLTREMRNMMIISALVYFAIALPFMSAWGNHGLWAAFLIGFAMRGLTLAARFGRVRAKILA